MYLMRNNDNTKEETLRKSFPSLLYQSKMVDEEKPSQAILNLTNVVINETLENEQQKEIPHKKRIIMESLYALTEKYEESQINDVAICVRLFAMITNSNHYYYYDFEIDAPVIEHTQIVPDSDGTYSELFRDIIKTIEERIQEDSGKKLSVEQNNKKTSVGEDHPETPDDNLKDENPEKMTTEENERLDNQSKKITIDAPIQNSPRKETQNDQSQNLNQTLMSEQSSLPINKEPHNPESCDEKTTKSPDPTAREPVLPDLTNQPNQPKEVSNQPSPIHHDNNTTNTATSNPTQNDSSSPQLSPPTENTNGTSPNNQSPVNHQTTLNIQNSPVELETYIDEPSIRYVNKFVRSDDLQEVKKTDNIIKGLIEFIDEVKVNNDLKTPARRQAIHDKIAEICSSILENNKISRESKKIIKAFQHQTKTEQGLYYIKRIKRFRCRHFSYTRKELLEDNYEPIYLDIVEACQRLILLPWKGAGRNDVCPMKFRTKVKLINPMEGQQLCFGYSTANVLDYIGYPDAATIVRSMAWLWSCLSYDQVINRLEAILQAYIPHISQPTVYGSPLTKKTKRKREISVTNVITSRDRFPWLVIPTFPDGTSCHILWMIDDIIIDTSCDKAIKRILPAFDWLCEGLSSSVTLETRHYNFPASPELRKGHPPYRQFSLVHFDPLSYKNTQARIVHSDKYNTPIPYKKNRRTKKK